MTGDEALYLPATRERLEALSDDDLVERYNALSRMISTKPDEHGSVATLAFYASELERRRLDRSQAAVESMTRTLVRLTAAVTVLTLLSLLTVAYDVLGA